jgi:hypothetical protein
VLRGSCGGPEGILRGFSVSSSVGTTASGANVWTVSVDLFAVGFDYVGTHSECTPYKILACAAWTF